MLKKSIFTLMAGAMFLGVSVNALAETKVYQGLGKASNFRVGPGKDSEGATAYSFNYVTAAGIFDENGKIINVIVDILELYSPNSKGKFAPRFSGWPGESSINFTDVETGNVIGKTKVTEESATKEVSEWTTKRERGEKYAMNPKNEWDKQMDNFQKFFKGKTVDELENWFARSTSDANGKPIRPKTNNKEDKEKFNKLTEAEKKEATDLVAGATMSVRDAHGDILGAIKNAYENRVEVIIP